MFKAIYIPTMVKRAIAASIVGLSLAGGVVYASDDTDDHMSGEVPSAVSDALEAAGYTVKRVEMEDGLYEAYAMRDGNRYEVMLDRAGNIVEVEEE